ncbi:MAG: dipeptide epimerase [Fimbriimonadaceae bacterium]|nr:MAG: dipeptide epimerase [Fimbriimonadaceae bacterium]
MEIRFQTVRLNKRFPLQISRGTSAGSENLYVYIDWDGVTGIGECAPGISEEDPPCGSLIEPLERLFRDHAMQGPERIWAVGHEAGVPSWALAGLDVAYWDWLAKKANLPLHRLLGLAKPTVPTSVTVGINPPDVVTFRCRDWVERFSPRFVKLKLGSPAGIEADQAAYEAAETALAGTGASLRVDANGGWNLADAKTMLKWLAGRGCDYVEQPLAAGTEDMLPELLEGRLLPVFLDESIRTSRDVVRHSASCDGVNLKLMKTGGITEAMRVIGVARAHGLQTMIGCMGESSVAIGAAASISGIIDHIDLDSHLNLEPDPATGLDWKEGMTMPSDAPGHGCWPREAR